MGYFPFFVEIKGKKALIVGGGRVAAGKAERLLPFEPEITVIAPEICSELKELLGVSCLERPFLEEDVHSFDFVIAASDDAVLNATIARLCERTDTPINVVDDKDKCSFIFPALVKRGKLTAAVTTEGASPHMAAAAKAALAAELPDRTEEILDYLADLREPAKERIMQQKQRSAFLRAAAERCMELERPLREEETERLFAEYIPNVEKTTAEPERSGYVNGKAGSVTLVGAGCGAFDLITLRGFRALRRAEALVYDDLMDEQLLAFAPESCERIYVGKRMGAHYRKQEEINALLVELAQQGKQVVRLKGGDPFVFGRGGEEIAALKAAGIPVFEIPGITSAIAVPAQAGIPVTERGMSRSFHVVTGHTANGDGLPEQLETLAQLEGTCIFLMGLAHLEEITEGLLGGGKPADTPAAVIHGTFGAGAKEAGLLRGEPGESPVQAVRGTLADIAAKTREVGMCAPAVIIVGKTAGLELL